MKRILVLLSILVFAAFMLTACEGDDGKAGMPGLPGINGDAGAEGPEGPAGPEGQSPIIVVDNATVAECPNGGKVFITGFDNNSDGVIDVVTQKSYECINPEPAMSTSACITCHSQFEVALVESKHYNTYSGAASASCLPCHGKTDDFGQNADAIDPDKVNGLNCLSCHTYNGKIKHNVVHSSYAADSLSCGSATSGCHSGTFHTSGHKFTDNASGKWEISSHGYMGNDNLTAMSSHSSNDCKNCHIGSFFRDYSSKKSSTSQNKSKAFTSLMGEKYGLIYEVAFAAFDPEGNIVNNNDAGFNSLANRSVGCATCHEPHSLGLRVKAIVNQDPTYVVKSFVDNSTDNTIAAGTTIFSAEYVLCTSCHAAIVEPRFVRAGFFTAVLDEAAQKAAGLEIGYHDNNSSSSTRTISDTHFAGKYGSNATTGNPLVEFDKVASYVEDAAFAAGGYVNVAGYGVQVSSANACSSCHDVHLTSKMGFFNKHSKTDNEAASASADTYDMYKLSIEAAAASHAGAVDLSTGKMRKGLSLRNGCNSCHAAEFAAQTVTNRLSPIPSATMVYNADNNTMGCATCHDMTMVIDNATGVLIPRVTGIKGFESNVRSKTGIYRFPWANAAYTEANKSLSADDTTKFESSLLCITCHVSRRGAPALIGQDNATGVPIETTSAAGVDIHHRDTAATHFLGLYFKGNLPAGKDYVAAGAHTNKVSAGVNTCTSCHGVSKDTHVFTAVVGGKFTGNAIAGCGCHSDNDVTGQFDEITIARTGAVAFYTVGGLLANDIAAKTMNDNGSIANYSLFNNTATNYTIGASIHGGKLAKQIAFDSITQLLTSTAACSSITIANLDTCSLLSANGADVTALKAWLGSATSLGR